MTISEYVIDFENNLFYIDDTPTNITFKNVSDNSVINTTLANVVTFFTQT